MIRADVDTDRGMKDRKSVSVIVKQVRFGQRRKKLAVELAAKRSKLCTVTPKKARVSIEKDIGMNRLLTIIFSKGPLL